MDEDSIFAAATQKSTPAERAAFLDEACGRETPLRARLERLLHAPDHPDSFPSPPAPAVAWEGAATSAGTAAALETAALGTQIGPYRLLQQIGAGGMGVVFLAEQSEPVRRRVALKLIKPGMDSRQVVTRFEAERQAQALMDHPNIAKVFDAGATDAGRPYFVMELVKAHRSRNTATNTN
jgi:eukaryotic-like serine/threonine-protein kinase